MLSKYGETEQEEHNAAEEKEFAVCVEKKKGWRGVGIEKEVERKGARGKGA